MCKNGPKGPANKALSLREFLASKQINVLEHLPHALDLALSDSSLFPKTKEILNRGHFDDTDDSSSEGHSTKSVSELFQRVD
jgi:hypothetical protein